MRLIFDVGTKKNDGKYLTDGGRVLNICAKGKGKDIIKAVYDIAEKIDFKDKYYRKDIGKALN